MTVHYSTQMAKLAAVPPQTVPADELDGRMRPAKFDVTTDGTEVVNDTIELCTLRAGVRVYGGSFKCEALGATTQMKIGIASDDDAFLEATATSTAIVDSDIANTIARNYGFKTTAETKVIATVLGATLTAAKKITGHLQYASD